MDDDSSEPREEPEAAGGLQQNREDFGRNVSLLDS